MADLSLQIDLAISAVKVDDNTKKKKKNKTPKRNEEKKSRTFERDGLDAFYSDSAIARRQHVSGRSEEVKDDQCEQPPMLLHEEYDDSEEDDSDSEIEEDSVFSRPRLARDGSRKKIADLKFRQITGQVAPSQLSVAKNLDEVQLHQLTRGENYGVVFSSSNSGNIKSKRRGRDRITITVEKYELEADDLDDEEEMEANDDNSEFLVSNSSTKKIDRAKKESSWPPPGLVESPLPPRDKPPQKSRISSRRFGSGRKSVNRSPQVAFPVEAGPPHIPPFQLQAKNPLNRDNSEGSSVSSSSSSRKAKSPPPKTPPRPPRPAHIDSPNQQSHNRRGGVEPPVHLKKQTSMGGLITGGMKKLNSKLPTFRTSTSHGHPMTRPMSLKQDEERFLVATSVPWIVPPPPEPRTPPKDGSNEEQIQLDFELLHMFIEDLRSTCIKLDEKRDVKSAEIEKLQHQIEKMDDEIADLVQPKGRNAAVRDAMEHHLTSVTSGKVFRVEKY